MRAKINKNERGTGGGTGPKRSGWGKPNGVPVCWLATTVRRLFILDMLADQDDDVGIGRGAGPSRPLKAHGRCRECSELTLSFVCVHRRSSACCVVGVVLRTHLADLTKLAT